jgi:hypothetical protein
MLPVFSEQSITAAELIQAAIVAAARHADVLQQQIDTVREP